jgi:hypothetical protein
MEVGYARITLEWRLPMCQTHIFTTRNGLFVYSWTDGVRMAPAPRIKHDDDAQAFMLWLQKHGYPDEAERFLEAYCAHKRS